MFWNGLSGLLWNFVCMSRLIYDNWLKMSTVSDPTAPHCYIKHLNSVSSAEMKCGVALCYVYSQIHLNSHINQVIVRRTAWRRTNCPSCSSLIDCPAGIAASLSPLSCKSPWTVQLWLKHCQQPHEWLSVVTRSVSCVCVTTAIR